MCKIQYSESPIDTTGTGINAFDLQATINGEKGQVEFYLYFNLIHLKGLILFMISYFYTYSNNVGPSGSGCVLWR